ncbi:MAG: porin family protein, partial [Verrucomicrobiaceae bacterium]
MGGLQPDWVATFLPAAELGVANLHPLAAKENQWRNGRSNLPFFSHLLVVVLRRNAMRSSHKIALAVVATAVMSGSALAADLITVPTSTPAALPVYEEAAGFDWNGFYAGVYGGIQNSPVGGMQYGGGVMAGVNAQFDFYLLGAEVAVQGITGGNTNTSYGQILGRAGLVVSDNVVVYAAGGYGIDLGVPEEDDALLGGGVELAVTDNVSVRAQ